MENQDKLYEQFKDAAGRAEEKGFDRMEAVWNRVEEKLDNKKQRRIAAWWKYTGIAALFLLFLTIGTFMLNNEQNPVIAPKAIPENNITVIDTQKINEAFDPEKESRKEEVVFVERQSSPSLNDSVSSPTKIWIKASDKGEFRVKGEITNKEKNNNVPTPLALPFAFFQEEGTEEAQMQGSDAIESGTSLEAVVVDVYRTTTSRKTTSAVTTLAVEVISKKDARKARREAKRQKEKAENNSIVSASPRYFRDGDQQSEGNDYVSNDYIAKESIESIQDRANATVLQSLQGQVAGLTIATGSGQPGSDSTIVLRGVGTVNGNVEPLYVIDGMPVDEDGFRSIDQNDIESFQILKDAAATSIYGNRGANGVIVITTKSGMAISDTKNIDAITALGKDKEARFLTPEMTAEGLKEPLYVLNGRPAERKKFRDIKPEDIESVIVLADDSAIRLYGDDGANGVMIINTEKRSDDENKKLEELYNRLKKIKPDYKEIKYNEQPKIEIDEEEYESFIENPFENPAIAPLSTFSIDVDNASYTNIRRFLNNGQTVPKDAVRVEEMINFFKYEYPQPAGNDPFSINTEYSDAPWNPKHKLLRIGLQGKVIPQTELPASNFVFLIDVSGSMNADNKLPLLKQSMKLLVKRMRREDRIAIVVYAGAAGLVLPSTRGDEKQKIYEALDNLEAGGSTAGGAGIELAYKTAQENFLKNGNNRVILATDGDFNVGASSDTDMQELIEEKRKSGVFLTCLGYGMGNYKDSKLETLADKGNGNYAYIDNMQEAGRFLDKEFEGSMYAIAKDVKIQIEFNPKHVQSYRLIGYENRKLRDEDFVNDAIDAGELGSGHTVTALYEIIPVGVQSDYFTTAPELKYSQPGATATVYSDELATIKFRHKKPGEDKSSEMVKIIPTISVPLQQASGDFKFTAAVAWFGLKLRDSKLIPNKTAADIKELAKQGLQNDPEGYRAEFVRLVDMVE